MSNSANGDEATQTRALERGAIVCRIVTGIGGASAPAALVRSLGRALQCDPSKLWSLHQ